MTDQMFDAPVVTEVFLHDKLPVQGVATVKGQEVFFHRTRQNNTVYRCWTLSKEEWNTVHTQPMNGLDQTDLVALFYIVTLRKPLISFNYSEADWSAVEK